MRSGYSLEQRLIDAVFLEDLEEVQHLLAAGASPNARDEDDRPPLVTAALTGNAELVRLLLDGGADPNSSDGDGWTALHVASARQRLDLVWTLLQAGADPNAQDQDGNSVLWRATLACLGNTGVTSLIDLLRRNGARDDVPNKAGISPRAVARRISLAVASHPHLRPS